jgi:hypothetical protein
MHINRKYYQDLWDKYQDVDILDLKLNSKLSILTLKMLLENCRNKKPLHINFQNYDDDFRELEQQLFVALSNEIFCNAADFPQLNIGDKVKSKTAISVGGPKPRFLDFKIISISNDKYVLLNEKFSFTWEKSFSQLVEKFIPVTQKAQNETITRFTTFFEKLNGKQVHDFTPTYFERKSVFIAPKTFYDSLEVRTKIPTSYYPNPREEINPHEIKSIPALPDSIMYVVSKYKECYDKIIRQGKKIDTIVVCDTEEKEIEQIIQDRNRFSFNLIVLTNMTNPIKYSQVPCWNWYKEEIDIVNSL